MITVDRRSSVAQATPSEVFQALSDSNRIESLLPRMRKVEVVSRNTDSARLVTHMAMGGIFGTIRCEGDLHWVEPHEIVFKVKKPLPLEMRWHLTPSINGTDLKATLQLDLTPLVGPMAKFIPRESVMDMIGKELESALKELSLRLGHSVLQERAVSA